ncbi:MAG TPA: hypothetical protein VFH45_02175 [Acidimicrobiales bacterium]|nr:hypothetical protein [Acidimicrobiales bacterium]
MTSRLRRAAAALGLGPRTTGRPASSNGASSLHLIWDVPSGEELTEVSVVLTVPVRPAVPKLYFWALQVGFGDGGGAHLGLQWAADAPRRMRHVNWGGYGPSGGELTGTLSDLPSSFDNPNTRDYDWEPDRPYRLRIARTEAGWGAWVEGVLVRHLAAPGDTLSVPMVWSEVFADCDDPPVSVRWSEPEVVTRAGRRVAIRSAVTSYQSRMDGGCDNTTSTVDGGAFVQSTAVKRLNSPGARLTLG